MSSRNLSRLLCVSLIFLATISIQAQQSQEPSKELQKVFLRQKGEPLVISKLARQENKRLFRRYGTLSNISLGVCVTGALADPLSTHGLYETNPAFRNREGGVRTLASIVASGGVCAVLEALEQKFPHFAIGGKLGFGAVKWILTGMNLSKRRSR